jgi:hypothetical protein
VVHPKANACVLRLFLSSSIGQSVINRFFAPA